ncbi:MgtC/SapB family protein [Pectinatus haikarae]|uniref:Mg2+ transporter-C (MgtC) family protein n=1 Tax=Pectinatus haikarae TaxID=349096 RepID=A0ABT9Y7M9_9FIRM|nr:MgtC/SapB family protein [Pectinatus haikarae]MDQ0203842.1 putative Mg2+ transporter-C (MgtC) family protein [Pectinatus haikarae]
MPTEWEACIRLVLSAILGGIIGYERQYKHKSAGLRTNVLVCVGSCLIMLLSQMIYADVEGKTNADPARLAAQVVSGIGFLGAGAIIKEGVNIIGLTTAACIWVVSGVGLAIGAGYYTGAFLTAAIVFAVLTTLSHMDNWMKYGNFTIVMVTEDAAGQVLLIYKCLKADQLTIRGMQILGMPNNVLRLEFVVHEGKDITRSELSAKLSALSNVISVEIF